MTHIRTRLQAEAGASAVELGLVLPFLAAILFGIVEFGLIFNAQLTLQHASREGVRVFSITKDASQAATAATAAAAASNVSAAVTTKDNGIVSSTCTHGVQASVTTTSTYSYITPMFGALFGAPTRNLSATGVMRCGG